MCFGDLLEVFQDAAFEVEDFGKAHVLEKRGCLLAADATGAEHRDLGVSLGIEVVADPFGEFAERGGGGINRAFEGADLDFVVVAGVDEDHVGGGDEVIPVGGLYIGADGGVGVGARITDGDDLTLQAHAQAGEGGRFGSRFLVGEICKSGKGAQGVKHGVDAGAGAGEGGVDAFRRQQEGAFDADTVAEGDEAGLKSFAISQGSELIERGHDEGGINCCRRCCVRNLTGGFGRHERYGLFGMEAWRRALPVGRLSALIRA